jgi:DNA adenine methylase
MKSLLKWVGGKAQIINNITELIPVEITNYYEPFLGGGTVLLNVLQLHKEKKITINGQIIVNDINTGLINFYKTIQNKPIALFEEINKLLSEYSKCPNVNKNSFIINRKVNTQDKAIKCRENYYYWKRKRFNAIDKSSIEYCALFWFINKTCFRGMYREGPNGYNVPFGHYKNPPSITKKDILLISELIKDVIFINKDYKEFINGYSIINDDFIYYDPPYAPENKNSFVGYNKGGFTLDNHLELFKLIKKNSAKFLMSNSKVDLVINNFNYPEYKINEIECKRHINAKKPGSKTMEVLITK